MSSFTEDKNVLGFAEHICGLGGYFGPEAADPFSLTGFCRRALHESLVLDTQDTLPLYLYLRGAIDSIASSRSPVPFVWDFRLIRAYYQHRHRIVGNGNPRLINPELLAYLCEMLEQALLGRHRKSSIKSERLSTYYAAPLISRIENEAASDNMDLS